MDVAKLEPLCVTGENEKWHSQRERQCGSSSKKSNVKLPYDKTSPILGYMPKSTENRGFNRCMYPNSHSKLTPYSQKVGKNPQMSNDGYNDKQNIIYI